MIVRRYIVRAVFEISEKLALERIKNLEEGDREKYNEKVNNAGDTIIWLNVEFLNKCNELLNLDKYFTEQEVHSVNLQCFQEGASTIASADIQILETFSHD